MLLFGGVLRNKLSKTLICFYKQQFRSMTESKKMIIYGDVASPPVRFAMMTASLLNIDLELHNIDLFKRENRTEFYKKINPLQKVPALSIDGDVICDSHAIALYLCRSSPHQELYPNDILLKAKVDEMLYYNSGVLFPIDSAVLSEFFAGKWPADEININNWYSALDYLELKLGKQKWLSGEKMRLCDICCGATVTSVETLVPLLDRHGNIKEWLKNLKLLPCFEINMRGLKRLQSLVDARKQNCLGQ